RCRGPGRGGRGAPARAPGDRADRARRGSAAGRGAGPCTAGRRRRPSGGPRRPGARHPAPRERRARAPRRGAGGGVKDTVIQVLIVVALVAQPVFLFYFLLYNTYTLSLVALSARQVRRRVAGH